jgi:hypothetical protein
MLSELRFARAINGRQVSGGSLNILNGCNVRVSGQAACGPTSYYAAVPERFECQLKLASSHQRTAEAKSNQTACFLMAQVRCDMLVSC